MKQVPCQVTVLRVRYAYRKLKFLVHTVDQTEWNHLNMIINHLVASNFRHYMPGVRSKYASHLTNVYKAFTFDPWIPQKIKEIVYSVGHPHAK